MVFREVAEGPTAGYQGDGSPPEYVSKGQLAELGCFTPARLRQPEEEQGEKRRGVEYESSSEESSSIGVGSESSEVEGEEEEEEEVQSKQRGGLGSLEALEESLPIKRGLSNFFSGKSKSFASLSDITSKSTVKNLAKPENPFNKRRRLLMACKSSRSSLHSSLNISMPQICRDSILEESEEEEEGKDTDSYQLQPINLQARLLKNFMSPRSFSLSDLTDANQ